MEKEDLVPAQPPFSTYTPASYLASSLYSYTSFSSTVHLIIL